MFVPLLAGLSLVGIIYGALVAMVQVDVKRLVAFSSVSHLGFVVLGIFALNVEGMTGAMLQMLNHGFSTGALFLIVGMIYERRHTRMIADFGGLSTVMPVFATFFLIVALSSIGLPGLNGFVGEFLVLLGAFQAEPLWAVVAGLGVILAAVYMLWMFQRVMFGEVDKEENRGLKDLNLREAALLLVMVFFIIQFGVYPKPYIDRIEPSLKLVLKRVEARTTPPRPAAVPIAGKPAAQQRCIILQPSTITNGETAQMGIETSTVMLSIIGPEVVLVLAALGIMMTDLFVKSDAEQPFLMWIGFVGILGALAVSTSLWGKEAAYGFYGMVVADNFSAFFTTLFLIAGGLTLLMSSGYVRAQGIAAGEYYTLTLFATTGWCLWCRART